MNYNLNNIPQFSSWVSIEPLNKGWSKDKKFIVTDKNSNKFVLRISNISTYEKREKQFNLLKLLKPLNLNCPKPIAFEKLNDDEIYMLITYLEGVPASKYVRVASDEESYSLGVEAGKILKTIHNLSKTDITEYPKQSWYEKYIEKIEKKINTITNSENKFDGWENVCQFIKDNMFLTKDRPYVFTHGDFHLGNMVVNNGHISIIDFDKCVFADAYDEFKCFCWNVFENPYFECGLINEYFNNNVPTDFFKILKLYAAESIISHLPWANTFGEKEITTAYKVINSVMKWYDNFNLDIPTWYKK